VTGDRARGVLLYALAGVLLLAGGGWFLAAAPETGEDPRVAAWRATAEEQLPDASSQAMAETIVLSGNATTERSTPVDGGSYRLTMVCAGTGRVRARLSSIGNDTGMAVPCTDDPSRVGLTVGLADEFFMLVSAESTDAGGAVFRWRLERIGR
jgi:Family of unknown function (DUF6023)